MSDGKTTTATNSNLCAYSSEKLQTSRSNPLHNGKRNTINRVVRCDNILTYPKENTSTLEHKQSTRRRISARLRQALRHR
jgi:hypothetical protein